MKNEINIAHVEMEITSRCNMNCQHCRAPHNSNFQDMSLDQIKNSFSFINTLRRASGKNCINYKLALEGGEPTMHPKFFEIIKLCKLQEKNGCEKIILNTNGSLLSAKDIIFLKKIKLKKLVFMISLDGITAKVHDSFRNYPGSFNKAIGLIEQIRNAKIKNSKIIVKTSITPGKIKDTEKYLKFFKKLNISEWHVTDIWPNGKGYSNKKLRMNKNEKKIYIKKMISLIDRYSNDNFMIRVFEPLAAIFINKNSNKYIDNFHCNYCDIGTSYFSIKTNGDVWPCELLNLKITNIFKKTITKSVKEYLNSPILKNLTIKKTNGKCNQCKIKNCYGCRARAMAINNDYLGDDPDCWL